MCSRRTTTEKSAGTGARYRRHRLSPFEITCPFSLSRLSSKMRPRAHLLLPPPVEIHFSRDLSRPRHPHHRASLDAPASRHLSRGIIYSPYNARERYLFVVEGLRDYGRGGSMARALRDVASRRAGAAPRTDTLLLRAISCAGYSATSTARSTCASNPPESSCFPFSFPHPLSAATRLFLSRCGAASLLACVTQCSPWPEREEESGSSRQGKRKREREGSRGGTRVLLIFSNI